MPAVLTALRGRQPCRVGVSTRKVPLDASPLRPIQLELTSSRLWRSLGKHVSIFEITTERAGSLDMWDFRKPVDLKAMPYNLAEVFY